MSVAAAPKPVDGRSTDIVTLPRARVEESWMDVHAGAMEARDELGHALIEKVNDRDPWPRIFAADRRLARIDQDARRHAAEAAGITFIHPNQIPLFDGCLTDDGTSA